jgi:glutamine synthetase
MTGTPLERHREANADAGALAAIRERIEASGAEYLYYQGVTISGRVIGKVVPARHLLGNAERGVQLHLSAAADLQTTREGRLLGGGAEAPEFTMMIRVHEAFTAKTGLELRSGCGPEMTWTGQGLEAKFRPGSSPAYRVEHLERYRPVYQKVIGYAQALEFQMYAEAAP